ncbi:RidA family protein [Rhizobium leguminosarum]|uniref:RidA family protein n=1 Tax=Rhizobium leguminosarum TaxID=384 RepID=UPI001FEED0B3|nr:RidA family protein [Rhizobium leguminosarum]
MQPNPRAKLAEIGIELPTPVLSVANYVPALQFGGTLPISRQLPFINGGIAFSGRLGEDVDLNAARQAAARCAINLLAIVDSWCGGDWDRIVRCVRPGGFFQVADNSFDLLKAMNGASDLLVNAMDDKGRHVRTTVGVATLPITR